MGNKSDAFANDQKDRISTGTTNCAENQINQANFL